MEFSRSYLPEFGLVVTTTPEELTDGNLLNQVIGLNKEAADERDLKEFADSRKLRDVARLTVAGAIRAGSAEADRPGSLLALLIPDDKLIFGMARAYQTFAEERRKSVRIFTDAEEALDWLDLCEEARDKVRELLEHPPF